ncbi:hypothetical protein CANTEDRAFT_130236 [Yamadazyma tenuis ATCC 10573]|uniref:Amino acid permease/ SLC12A domain-containing protein n=1 Tax=Candida tenuis (strain ATCC 10573 / BCRC 21748 / CBS 615 / JCM 9827 / NBRC 10315 / NRRL Y-1498 / VKM Y-70) TaxID=590646 RepID=G3B4R7_CANTC|nr:uncharacterized protein CANTEDRAFT_130236 [Yamadazyma tenuis ATCC 10573]EGV63855.1 hypothetical protein CANTEDRAFT_130236 [Yamadazyma tenuis ATCC 10573]
MNDSNESTHLMKSPKLGTFSGVFIPTSLNVLSILMFLRFGFIVGQMGILGALGLLILSYLIDMLTVMSVSAIATNGTVKGGGAYYMISRSLGPEFGGAIGIIFFIGQILNSSLNVVGFIESLLVNFGQIDGDLYQLLPVGYFWTLLYSTILLALCTGVALVGANVVSKAALWLFVLLVLSTLSIPLSTLHTKTIFMGEAYQVGLSWRIFKENLFPHFTKGAAGSVLDTPETFRDLFGIFFPATSGIYAGASMSGALKDPSKSIPQGTIRGLVLTFVLYGIVILSIGTAVPRQLLYKDIKVIQTVNLQGYVIIIGELSTSLFSVIMGVVGAASLLNAIANDRIIPGLSCFNTKKKSINEQEKASYWAILATWVLAQLFLFADINQIAVFVTMAFLMTFIVTNLACFLLKIGSAPNFRPSFKYFNVQTAFSGSVLSVIAMFIVDGMSASLVIISLLVLILLIHYSTPPSKFGDISQLLIYHQVRKYLLRLKVDMNVKYWRPQILLLCDNPRSSWNLIGFCNHLKKGGLYVLGHVVILNDDTITKSASESDSEFSITAYKEVQKQKSAWIKLRDMANIKAFVQIALGPTLPWGVRNVYLGSGLGGMKPNITVLGFFDFAKHGLQLPLTSFKNKSQFRQLPTDDCREEQQVSINQWVQVVEDLVIMQSSVAVAANFTSLEVPSIAHYSVWSKIWRTSRDTPKADKKFIDLYPIQMSSINEVDGMSVLSTNFDTYTLILQLGSILSSVPEWKYNNHQLRVIVFVEDKSEVPEEKKRLTNLLQNLRIEAKIKVICLNDGSLSSYNYIVKGYTKNASNKFMYDKIDKILKYDQWWKNLTNARETLAQIEKQKLKKKTDQASWYGTNEYRGLGLNRSNTTTNKNGRQRRDTISNLHDKGLSLSFNMHGGILNYDGVENAYSSDDDDEFDEDTINSSKYFQIDPPVESQAPDKLAKNLNYKLSLKFSNHLASDQVSVKSSRSNLKPNFVSLKTPNAQLQDNEDDENENEDTNNVENDTKQSIGFIDDGTNCSKSEENSKKKSHGKSSNDRSGMMSPSIISNDDGIIQQLKTPQFLAVDDDEDIPSLNSSTTNLPALTQRQSSKGFSRTVPRNFSTLGSVPQQQPLSHIGVQPDASELASSEGVITQKQLQQELKELSFDDIPAKGQHIILNDLMKLHSAKVQTGVIFSTLPAPSLNTHLDDNDSFEYVNNLSIWLHDLPPVVLLNSQTVTVTTAL